MESGRHAERAPRIIPLIAAYFTCPCKKKVTLYNPAGRKKISSFSSNNLASEKSYDPKLLLTSNELWFKTTPPNSLPSSIPYSPHFFSGLADDSP